jgi:glycosyltransferase involved in cell wall biosynthesis
MENMADIRGVYRQTGILIMPSHYESYGRTAVEAMCSGIPVIANPTPGLLESCGSAGYFADRNKLDEWVEAIRDVFKNYEYWSKRAKLRAEDLQDQSARELGKLEQFCVDIVNDKFKHNL